MAEREAAHPSNLLLGLWYWEVSIAFRHAEYRDVGLDVI
jgi:hypothetical protein